MHLAQRLARGPQVGGVAGLVSGTWEDVIAPAAQFPPSRLLTLAFRLGPIRALRSRSIFP